MFKKNKENKPKMKNTIALKRNVYAVIISVIFIVAIVAVTALSTVLAQNFPLDIDLTTNKQHSMSDKNFDYIKDVKEKINIYVTMTESQYNSTTNTALDLSYIVAKDQTLFVDYNAQNEAYYRQTVELLKKYNDYNENITVTFVDIYDAKARDITDRFENFSWSSGDILVEGSFKLDGKDVVRRTVVPFRDTYTLKDTSGTAEYLTGDGYMYQVYYGYAATAGQGYGYFVTENKIETMISSAIYKVTSPDTPVFLVPTLLSNKEGIQETLENLLQVNNFAVEYSDQMLSVLLTAENYEKYDGIILSDCKSDISESDRALLDNFLSNAGKRGKSLFYFAGTNTYNLKNLCGFLGDWGIGFENGILYETDESWYSSGEPTSIGMSSVETDYTASSEQLGKPCLVKDAIPMKQLWPSSVTATYSRETTVIMHTGSTGATTIMPIDANIKEWKPAADAVKDKYPTAILTRDDDTVNNKLVSSFVVAFSSASVIKKDYNVDSLANSDVVLATFNEAAGKADSAFSFVPKTIDSSTYITKVTENRVIAIRIIFMAAVPVIVIAIGIVVWIRRKRK